MKFIVGCWLGLLGCLSAGVLTFSDSAKEVTPKPAETSAVFDFPFVNKTDKPLTIQQATGACSCVTAAIEGGKTSFAPGESGVVRATFDFGSEWGVLEKDVLVFLKGDPESAPSHHLKITVNVPILIELEPKTVKWDIGEKPEPKTFRVTMKGAKPIHISTVTSGSSDFLSELKTIEDGRSYSLVVTPKGTESQRLAVFKLQTDCEVTQHSVQQVFALVKKPVANGH